MADSPPTRPSLLLRIRDPADHGAWSQFTQAYAPLIYGYARSGGAEPEGHAGRFDFLSPGTEP